MPKSLNAKLNCAEERCLLRCKRDGSTQLTFPSDENAETVSHPIWLMFLSWCHTPRLFLVPTSTIGLREHSLGASPNRSMQIQLYGLWDFFQRIKSSFIFVKEQIRFYFYSNKTYTINERQCPGHTYFLARGRILPGEQQSCAVRIRKKIQTRSDDKEE